MSSLFDEFSQDELIRLAGAMNAQKQEKEHKIQRDIASVPIQNRANEIINEREQNREKDRAAYKEIEDAEKRLAKHDALLQLIKAGKYGK